MFFFDNIVLMKKIDGLATTIVAQKVIYLLAVVDYGCSLFLLLPRRIIGAQAP